MNKTTPSPSEIKRFIEVFDVLDTFEAECRHIRGYGALKEGELPVPEVTKVMNWLKEMSEETDYLPSIDHTCPDCGEWISPRTQGHLCIANFDDACDDFSRACTIAEGWKHNYPGAAYSTRLGAACDHLEIAIAKIRKIIKGDSGT